MAYYNPIYNWVGFHPLYTENKQVFFMDHMGHIIKLFNSIHIQQPTKGPCYQP